MIRSRKDGIDSLYRRWILLRQFSTGERFFYCLLAHHVYFLFISAELERSFKLHDIRYPRRTLFLSKADQSVLITKTNLQRTTSQTCLSVPFFTSHLYVPASFWVTFRICRLDHRPGTDTECTGCQYFSLLHKMVFAGAPCTIEQFSETNSTESTVRCSSWKWYFCILQAMAFPSKPEENVMAVSAVLCFTFISLCIFIYLGDHRLVF